MHRGVSGLRISGLRISGLRIAALFALAVALGSCGASSADPGQRSGAGRHAGAFVPDAPRSHAVLWAAGDGADGAPGARAVAKLVGRGHPDAFLYLGDVYPDGTPGSFAHGYAPTFGALADRTAPSPGNHDWPEHRQGYGPYWTKARGRPPPPYYSFRAGGWQVLSLNSEIATGPGSPQLRWLRKRLARPGDCRIAFWHRPRFSAGQIHGDDPRVEPLWRALRGRARLVVNGHEHDMQRMRPRGGLVEVVSGAGGHSFYGIRRGYRGLAFANSNEFGALRIDLHPGAARTAFITISGRTIDRARLRCRPGGR